MVEVNRNEINAKLKKIKAESKINEPYLVAILWNEPEDGYGEYGDILNRDHFINEEWGFFYQLGKELYKDGVKNFDDITIMKKIKVDGTENLFDEYGGFDVIEDAVNIIKERDSNSNIKYYSESILKNYTIRKLYSLFGAKVLVDTDMYKVSEMSRDNLIIYWGDKMNSIALESTTSAYETENLYIDADEFLLRLQQDGEEMLKFSNSPLLNTITQGMPKGHVTMIGGFGNSGKSSITADKVTMACIENEENMLVLLNEEDAQAYRQKILLSILHRDRLYIDRKKLVKGDLSEEDKKKVKRGFEKLNEYLNGDEAKIKIIFMEKYVMKDLEKIIRFWANRGYDNLLIDTHKVSDDSTHNARWETFVEDMKTIYRLTRKNAGGCNLRTIVTFQLADSAIRNRFLDFEAIGEGKASKNEASIVLMFRACWADEYEGGKSEIEYYTLDKKEDGKYRKNAGKKLPKHDKNGNKNIYYLLFTPKNRSGSTNATGQEVLILQARFHTNSFQEIGWTTINDDKGSRR